MTSPASSPAARPLKPGRWGAAALALPLLAAIIANAIALWPEVSLPVPSLNDDAVHYLMVQRASETLSSGESPVDHWVPEVELGFPAFLYYQHVPHLAVVFLHRALLGRVDLLTVFNAVRYAILIGFPLIVYWAMRRLEFSVVAALVAAAASSLLSADGRYSFEYGSYIWRGHGMYTQLWAMPLSFVALACLDRLIVKGRGYVAAILACSLLALAHLIYAYMMAISALVLLVVGLRRDNVAARIGRLCVVGALAGTITSYMWLPFVLGKAYLAASPYLQRWKYDSFGAHDILGWLVDGDLLDAGRLPVLTALLAVGVAAALFTRTRPARLALVLFGAWLVLYFGRVTWGQLADLLPMHEGLLYHRFIGGLNIAIILLIGLGGDWLWRRCAPLGERWRAAAVGLVVLALLMPALRERWQHYALNTQWIERTRRALAADDDARAILTTLSGLPPGRTYAGLRADWGKTLQFGDLNFRDLLTFHRIAAVTPPYSSWSLNADLIWHFDDHNPTHFDVMNVRYLVAPPTWTPPAFLRPVKETRRYVLYEDAVTGGYGAFATVTGAAHPLSQTALFTENRAWFQSAAPAEGRVVRNDFPGGEHAGVAGTAEAGPSVAGDAACHRDGKTRDERVRPGRIELRAECGAAATLVLKVTYHPNWRVAVDGREVPTFMVSPSYIGVNVSAGAHQISAVYRSSLLKTILLITGGVTLIAVIGGQRRFAAIEHLWTGSSRSETERPERRGKGSADSSHG